MTTLPKHDVQTVTPDGSRIMALIEGVQVRYSVTQADARGTLTEVYDPRWGFSAEPMVYAYIATINPGATKAWIKHEMQEDRLYFLRGSSKVVLFDDRSESSTKGMINEFVFTERNQGLLLIPRQVWHGIANVSNVETVFLNLPTNPYNHAKPDKLRLPADTPYIPYNILRQAAW